MNIQLLISEQALNRSKRDKYIKNNWKVYRKEILMLGASSGNRPTEKIGDFFITPRGHVRHRIAWHFAIDTKTDTKMIYIDDVLYKISESDYVGNWADKSRDGKINLGSYGPHVPFQ